MTESRSYRRPDIEFRRLIGAATYRTYGHIYWRPLIVVALGHVLIGRKHLTRKEAK
jgi:hypothetical protein